jgi:hypothetical protein
MFTDYSPTSRRLAWRAWKETCTAETRTAETRTA